MLPVPERLQRLVDQVDGWLDLRCPERALELLPPLLDDPEGRALGLELRVRANARLGEYRAALIDLDELRPAYHDQDWLDLTEAWCRRRAADLPGAIACAARLVARTHQSGLGWFNLACYHALAGDATAAIDALSVACGLGAEFRDFAKDEPDFDSLRRDERFRHLLRT
ncbi:MAG: hypothetical protein H6835_09480 [Planctomycetes bacterium]|nr:hypothetical protein [Planctomycetota bacterium]